MTINLALPTTQCDFAKQLTEIRHLYLQDALKITITRGSISLINSELDLYTDKDILAQLAASGLRGEFLYAVPSLLALNPRLLAYYRLLLGFSQKIFYTKTTGLSAFKSMEERGQIATAQTNCLPNLCLALNESASFLASEIGVTRISKGLLDDLTLLTLGPQLRGGRNNTIGTEAIVRVFEIIREIIGHNAKEMSSQHIRLTNAAGRSVLIQFASDPDIIIKEEMASTASRNVIAIEVKGGTDRSNIHNRIGEAEKSHQKAKSDGFYQCWTVVNVDSVDRVMAKKESPTTNFFFALSNLEKKNSSEYQEFRDYIISHTGIKHKD